MTAPENDLVQKAYEKLSDSYSRSNHRKKFEIINKAFKFAEQAHKGVKRRSGEPYIMHPLAVAQIVSDEMGLGSTSISAALLHDVVEDTDYTVEDIKNLFGEKIAQIVDGLTKISGGIFAEAASAQAENMRRLLLTMSEDIRVILIKIADRLHNMRTLGSMLPAKQYKIAGETLYLYAPMAHRLGLFTIKSELEDLSFKYEHPEEYHQIEQKLAATAENRELIYNHFATPVIQLLDDLGYQYKIQSRVKSIYSIWSKMQEKKVGFSDIYDIFAVRIVFEPKPNMDVKKQCWEIYSAITDIYKLRPDRIRDWISRPKANGYQALHLTVMGPDGQWIEIQIRSIKMDEIAEKGFAAHWKYKEYHTTSEIQESPELDQWLERIQEILETPSPNAMDFLDTIKLNLYGSEIFVFTPKGAIKTLPQSATALDFAYEIHSNVGDLCIGAKVNHKLVPLSHKLSSGDQVEILTSKSQHPQEEWLHFVSTAKAKTKIEAYLKKQRRAKIKEGEKSLTDQLQHAGIEVTTQILDKFCSIFGFAKKDDLFYAFGDKQIILPEHPEKLLKEKTDNVFVHIVKKAFNAVTPASESAKKEKTEKEIAEQPVNTIDCKKTYILQEENFQKNFISQPCCHPVPGDDVFGYVRDDQQVEIHKISCPVGVKLKTRHGDRIISCKWGENKSFSFPATIEIKGIDRMGILNDITRVITNDLAVNVRKLALESQDGFFEGNVEVAIHNIKDIHKLITGLQKIKGVKNVIRVSE
ncbi:GTP pyrophosphokinase [Bacteroidia bacterium]|nr:GTP pyrophosphokinase [Bacteroidia bacterium]